MSMNLSQALDLVIEVAESGRAGAALEIVRAIRNGVEARSASDHFSLFERSLKKEIIDDALRTVRCRSDMPEDMVVEMIA